MQIGVVDYGAGNLRSVCRALWLTGVEPELITRPEQVAAADRIVLPGVGAAGSALRQLRQLGMEEALGDARRRSKPILGICLGMQLLADKIEEFGSHSGFGWLPGEVRPIGQIASMPCRVPHMGWSVIEPGSAATADLFGTEPRDRQFYFCHSNCLTTDPNTVAATARHGAELVAAIRFETIFAVQFHPEKSQQAGLRLLERFCSWSP